MHGSELRIAASSQRSAAFGMNRWQDVGLSSAFQAVTGMMDYLTWLQKDSSQILDWVAVGSHYRMFAWSDSRCHVSAKAFLFFCKL